MKKCSFPFSFLLESLQIRSVSCRHSCNPAPTSQQAFNFSESVCLENGSDNRFIPTSFISSENQVTYVRILSHLDSFQSHSRTAILSGRVPWGASSHEIRLFAGPVHPHMQVTLAFWHFVLYPCTSGGFNYAGWTITKLWFMGLEKQIWWSQKTLLVSCHQGDASAVPGGTIKMQWGGGLKAFHSALASAWS